jgi:AAA domain
MSNVKLEDILTMPADPSIAEFTVKTAEDAISGKAPEMLVGRWIPKGAFGALWGPEYVGKTFAALDITLSLSAGVPWLGIELPQAPTLYVVGEGRLRERIMAWQYGHPGADVGGFRYHDQGFRFADERQVEALLRYIEQVRPALVTFDSLAATIGGDENGSVEMGLVISTCYEIQRISSFTTAPLLIGHPGKDVAKGIRGHSSLAPALDVSIRVSGSTSQVNSHDVEPHAETGGTVRLHSRKNKDGALLPDLAATMRSGVESVYLVHSTARGLSDGARRMLRDLADAGGTKALHRWGDTSELHRNRQSELRTELIDSGHAEVNMTSGTVSITVSGEGEL